MSSRALRVLGVYAALVLASFSLAHEVIYLAVHGSAGFARAMEAAGHDQYWTPFVLTVVGVVGSLATVAIGQLVRLSRQAEAVRAGRVAVHDDGRGLLVRLTFRRWLTIVAWTTIAYLIQENAERANTELASPGLAVATGTYGIALPVIALVSLVVAFVAALVSWRRGVLLARLRRALGAARRRAPRGRRPPVGERGPTGFVATRQNPVRAPPPPSRRHLVPA